MTGAATVYVLEGADATGKSTFARRMGGAYFHNGAPRAGSTSHSLFDEYLQQIVRAVHTRDVLGISTVIDRSFLGELIYGAHRGSGPLLSGRQVRRLERYCRRNDVVLLGFTASIEDRKRRHAERGEPWTPLEAFTGADFDHYFQNRRSLTGRQVWTTVDSSSTPNENQ